MSDLIERLRKHREFQKGNSIPCDWHPLICTEAADEIERLRAVVDAAKEVHDDLVRFEGWIPERLSNALAALEDDNE